MLKDLDLMMRTRIIAIVRLEHYDRALEVARALVAGGVHVIEFTLTGRGAATAIASVRADLGESALIGAGTILTTSDVQEVVAAGAQFVVTPVFGPAVIASCRAAGIPVVCGAMTPTEIQTAYEAGAAFIKVFPVRQFGPQYIQDILAPLPHVRLIPTGGVTPENAGAYLKAGAVAVGIGGNLVSQRAVASEDWAQITYQAQICVQAARQS